MDLATQLEQIFTRMLPKQRMALKKLGLRTVGDLLYHFPYRYENPADLKKISEIRIGESARIWGRVKKIDYEKTWKKKMNIAHAAVEDPTGKIKLVWFRQPYIARMLPEGTCAIFSGKAAERKGELYIANPLFEAVPCNVIPSFSKEDASRLQPLYPASAGVSSLWISKAISKILFASPKSGSAMNVPEILPEELVKKYHLPNLNTALRWIHAPKTEEYAGAAKKRFAFEEVFLIQLLRIGQKEEIKKTSGFKFLNVETLKNEFISLLPFPLTSAQKRAISDIARDFASEHPMNRLLEGDVGSGKTAVAGCASYIAAKNGMQAAYMAPTEILARQHFETFTKTLERSGLKIGLLTSSISEKFPSKVDPKKSTHISRAQLLKWVREGEIDILIGTHALIEKKVAFQNLALAMVDEQHRFGVMQRSRLFKKTSKAPHFLTMTATPIPRTLALTIYGDLDVSILDEMPPGRIPIETKIVPPKERNIAYEFIRTKIKEGGQAFVICPRIEPKCRDPISTGLKRSDLGSLEMRSVKEEYKKLKERVFPELEIGIMHGRLTSKEKEETMCNFKLNKTHILVSTSVVEVGVDVPNATIMMIEGAERFGLAQLHQFRGRVGRSEKKSYCFLLPGKYSASIFRRLKALTSAKSGFELAEYDLEFRGAGELSGRRQWGMSDIGMEALKNLKMVEAARLEARAIIENNALAHYPLLYEKISRLKKEPLHFE